MGPNSVTHDQIVRVERSAAELAIADVTCVHVSIFPVADLTLNTYIGVLAYYASKFHSL